MNLYDDIPILDLFDEQEPFEMYEEQKITPPLSTPPQPRVKKINLNNMDDSKRHTYITKIRLAIEAKKTSNR